ncbi:MAG TPA: hypothetical protein VFG89_05895 [Coriobacteriia bacterium]|nr:hypothetical protein [Coriobacteriia bacterium]
MPDPIFAWLVSNAAWEGFRRGIDVATKLVAPPKPSANWIARINNYCEGELKVRKLVEHEPKVCIDGAYKFTPEQQAEIKRFRAAIRKKGRPNDPHAIVVGTPTWESDPVTFHACTLDYAGVKTLRAEGEKPALLSSCVVLVCPQTRQLVLHRRQEDVATMKGRLHTMGGGYMPPVKGGVDADRYSLKSTASREVHEESQLEISTVTQVPLMLSEELSTGFVQLVFLGMPITKAALAAMSDNWEGTVAPVGFDNLLDTFYSADWAPSGKGHVLSWLAIGAPGAGLRPKFGKYTASDLFDIVVGEQ